MPKIDQQISVKVADKREGERRRVTIEVDAPTALFTLSDVLAEQGAFKGLESTLRTATRETLTLYLKQGRTFIKAATNQTKKATQETKPSATPPKKDPPEENKTP